MSNQSACTYILLSVGRLVQMTGTTFLIFLSLLLVQQSVLSTISNGEPFNMSKLKEPCSDYIIVLAHEAVLDMYLNTEAHMVELYGDKGKCWSLYLRSCLEKGTLIVPPLVEPSQMISEQFKVQLAERLGATLPNVQRSQSSRRNYRAAVPSSAPSKQITHTTRLQSMGGQQSSTFPVKSTHEQGAGAQPKSEPKIRLVNQPLSTQMFSQQTVEACHAHSQRMFEQTNLTPPVVSEGRGVAAQPKSKKKVATNFNMSPSIQTVTPQTGQVDRMISVDNQFNVASNKQTTSFSKPVVRQNSSMFSTESTHLGSTAAVQSKSRTRGI